MDIRSGEHVSSMLILFFFFFFYLFLFCFLCGFLGYNLLSIGYSEWKRKFVSCHVVCRKELDGEESSILGSWVIRGFSKGWLYTDSMLTRTHF
jgi:hypothetical protein